MAAYKKDQGRMVRMAVFWAFAVLLYYGCSSLRQEMVSRVELLRKPLFEAFPSVPIIGVHLTGALLIAAVVFAGGLFLAHRWQERPKNADLLIETEVEMRKVTWPTSQEVLNSSIVVVICVLVLMGFLAGADWVLAQVTNVLLFGKGS